MLTTINFSGKPRDPAMEHFRAQRVERGIPDIDITATAAVVTPPSNSTLSSHASKSPEDVTEGVYFVFSPPSSTKGMGRKRSSFTNLGLRAELDRTPLAQSSPRHLLRKSSYESFSWQPKIQVFPYVANFTSDSSLAAHSMRYTSKTFDRIMQYITHGLAWHSIHQRDAETISPRRLSDVDEEGEAKATGKPATQKAKNNPWNTIGPGRIHESLLLQYTPAPLIDNNDPGELPRSAQGLDPNRSLLLKYQTYVGTDIKQVWLDRDNRVCWQRELPQYKVIETIEGGVKTKKEVPTGHKVLKFFQQEAVRLSMIFGQMRTQDNPDGIYEFYSATSRDFVFRAPHDLIIKLYLDDITPKAFLAPGRIRFNKLEEFMSYVYDNDIAEYHIPKYKLTEHGANIPIMVRCGKLGPITNDIDQLHMPIPLSMPRIASYAIFCGFNEKDFPKFIRGLKLLQKRLTCKNKDEFLSYIAACDFNLNEYFHPQELEAMKKTNYPFIIYLDPKYEEYEFYKWFIAELNKTLDMYVSNPNLLGLVCTTNPWGLAAQVAINEPLSSHGDESLNPCPGDFGVALNAVAIRNSETTQYYFIATDREEDYLALLFSDNLLQKFLYGATSSWLCNNERPDLSEKWLDLLELQALYIANRVVEEFTAFEFKMQWFNVIKQLDRRSAGSKELRPKDKEAIAKVNTRFQATLELITNKDAITDRIKVLQHRHSASSNAFRFAVAEAIATINSPGSRSASPRERSAFIASSPNPTGY